MSKCNGMGRALPAGLAASLATASAVVGLLFAVLAPRSAFSAEVTRDTKWWDAPPTNTIVEVLEGVGVATTDYVHKVAADALFALTNDFAANFTPLAAPLVTGLVEDVLAPRTLEFHYGADAEGKTAVTNAFVAPMFATSKVEFIRDNPDGDSNNDVAYMYSAGKLRNYSVLIDEIQSPYLMMSFASLGATHKIYAQPRLYDSTKSKTETGEPMPYCWDLYTNDVPCVVTIREPEAGTLVLRRDRLDQDEVYIKVEDGEAAVYTDGDPE